MIVNRRLLLFPILAASALAYGHAIGPMGVEPLSWQSEEISQVVGGGRPGYTHPQDVQVEGRSCVSGNLLNFNVRDEYAFDIDESVQLELQFYVREIAEKVTLTYDRNDTAPILSSGIANDPSTTETIELSPGVTSHWQTRSVNLEHARFSNRGFGGTDFSLATTPTYEADASGQHFTVTPHEFTVCAIRVKRSYTTAIPNKFGSVVVQVLDERGRRTPARMGIYDHTGRLPLPGEEALQLRNYNSISRIVVLREGAMPWPVKNHSVFYVDGTYGTKLPIGHYEVIIAKGPEYRIARQSFEVKEQTSQEVTVQLRRWTDMAANGWYSGDDHIHYARDGARDDRDLLRFIEAEDLHIGNILQAGNSGNTYFRQYAWEQIANPSRNAFVLIPGQEDPRTARRGHTIQLDVKVPVRDPDRYILYHEAFAKTHSQGAVTGYAHFGYGSSVLGERAGMALDIPYGLIDFAEVLQWGTLSPETWFDFLNLGYKLSPSAGTDFPYVDIPGAVRCYVRTNQPFTARGWLEGLRRGEDFVTNGPMLEFTLNGQGMGSELHLKSREPLKLQARATLNPDIDRLDRLELIEQGEVIKSVSSTTGADNLELQHEIPATHGSWFLLRAWGKQQKERAHIVAISAPIYVRVDGQPFWKPSAVPKIVEGLKTDMQKMINADRVEVENWDTDEPDGKTWPILKPLLEKRVDEVTLLYDALVKKAQDTRP